MRTISVFLIAVALIAGMVGYGGRESYTLTIATTTGGSVITPGEGTFAYYEGTTVYLVAGLELGHRFVDWTGDVGTVANVSDMRTTITINLNHNCSIIANFEKVNYMVAAGYYHTVGLGSDGTVIAVGDNSKGQSDVGGWTDIVQVAAGYEHTVGLRSDGTLVAVGYDNYGQCNVRRWTNIIQVAAGGRHTVGLKADGTLLAVGWNWAGQRNIGTWSNIVWVTAGNSHTVGVKSDGTVVAVGWNAFAQCAVESWDLN